MTSIDATPPVDDGTEVYIHTSSLVYKLFASTNTIGHGVLVFLMISSTPKEISALRRFLATTTIFDYMASINNCLLRPRLVSGISVNVSVYCYGLLNFLDYRICFGLYMLWQTLSLAVGASMIHTVFFKWYRFRTNDTVKGMRLFWSIIFFYAHCLISLVCGTIIVIRNILEETTVNDDSQGFNFHRKYLDIGQMTLGRIPNLINLFMMSLGIYIYPIVGIILSWHAGRILSKGISQQSPHLRKQAASLVKGILIQLIMQFLCYVPMFSIYVYSNLTKTEILFQQFFLALSPNIAATIDPLINMYLVDAYRKKISSLFRKKKTEVVPAVDPCLATTN